MDGILIRLPVMMDESKAEARWLAPKLRCTQCRGSCEEYGLGIRCSGCGKIYEFHDGILDFTNPDSHTQLDNIDYDYVYNIDIQQSFPYFEGLKSRVKPAMDGHHGCVVEIGSGTGFISVPMIGSLSYDSMVLTDVSQKMLRQCKQKVAAHSKFAKPETQLAYLALDGNAFSFGANAIDLAIGHGVLHHILDWKGFIRSLHNSLTENGVAVFVEPNYKFHVALSLMFNALMGSGLARPHWGSDLDHLLAFHQGLHCCWKLRNEPEFVRQLEDKHMFDRTDTLQTLNDLGFKADVLAAYGREFPSVKMAGYLNEMKVSSQNQVLTLDFLRSQQTIFAEVLDKECLASANIYVLEKIARCTPKLDKSESATNSAWKILEDEMPSDRRETQVRIERVESEQGSDRIRVTGWIFSSVPIKKVIVQGQDAIGFVKDVRTDVLDTFRGKFAYPIENLLFSGFQTSWFRSPPGNSLGLQAIFVDDKQSVLISAEMPRSRTMPLRALNKVVRSLRDRGFWATGSKVLQVSSNLLRKRKPGNYAH